MSNIWINSNNVVLMSALSIGVLIYRPKKSVGLSAVALDWFHSQERLLLLLYHKTLHTNDGVSQGSILGPILVFLYMLHLVRVIRQQHARYHWWWAPSAANPFITGLPQNKHLKDDPGIFKSKKKKKNTYRKKTLPRCSWPCAGSLHLLEWSPFICW